MSDLIDRQEAIDAFAKYLYKVCLAFYSYMTEDESKECATLILQPVPSAQTEIIRCKDCKWFDDIGCAIRIVDDTDKPSENDYCSFAER